MALSIATLTSAFTLVPASHASSGPTLHQIIQEVDAAGSPFNLPVVPKETKIPTPKWVKVPYGAKALWSVIRPNCYQPPKGISNNPLALTDAEIAKYGFPQRLPYVQMGELGEWVNLVKHSLHRSCLGTVLDEKSNSSLNPTKPSTAKVAENLHYSVHAYGGGGCCWSGYYQEEQVSHYWELGEGYWYQPNMPAQYDGSSPKQTWWSWPYAPTAIGESSWVGLDCDWNNGSSDPCNGDVTLVQEGSESDGQTNGQGYSCNGGNHCYSVSYSAWMENLDNESGETNYDSNYGIYPVSVDFTVYAGDEFYGSTAYRGGGSGSNSPLMSVDDITQGEYADDWEFGPQSGTYIFACIMENKSDFPIQMDTETWNQCDGEDMNGYHHAIASNNTDFAYFDMELQSVHTPANLDQYAGAACGSGCGDGGFSIYNYTLGNGDHT